MGLCIYMGGRGDSWRGRGVNIRVGHVEGGGWWEDVLGVPGWEGMTWRSNVTATLVWVAPIE